MPASEIRERRLFFMEPLDTDMDYMVHAPGAANPDSRFNVILALPVLGILLLLVCRTRGWRLTRRCSVFISHLGDLAGKSKVQQFADFVLVLVRSVQANGTHICGFRGIGLPGGGFRSTLSHLLNLAPVGCTAFGEQRDLIRPIPEVRQTFYQ